MKQLSVAIISNAPTPYRTNLHLRIVTEIDTIQLYSIFTHQYSNAPWEREIPSAINPMYFGSNERSDLQSHPLRQFVEWRKGGRIISEMRARNIAAVVLGGYNDLGRLRILWWCRRSGVPCFIFGDSNILAVKRSGWKAILKQLILSAVLRRASGAMYCGRYGRSYFLHYGVPPARLFPFPYEPDYDQLLSTPADVIAQMRERCNLKNTHRHLLFCGRLATEKRPDLIIQAFIRIAKDRPEWNLIFAGDGPLRQHLVAQLPAALATRVHFTGFINDSGDLAALYRCADVLILPSDYEPWGVVVSEAATGLALVCSDQVGAAKDLLHDGVNGRVFVAGDLNSLVDAVLCVTAESNIERMKAASPSVLAQWRHQSDPVSGLRAALASVGIAC